MAQHHRQFLCTDEVRRLAFSMVVSTEELAEPCGMARSLDETQRLDPSNPARILGRLGLVEDAEKPIRTVSEKGALRWQWRLTRLLHGLGFRWEVLVRHVVSNMFNKPEWLVKYCAFHYKFFTEPRLDTFLCFMDESFAYQGSTPYKTFVRFCTRVGIST